MKTLRTAALIVGAVALIASGIGAAAGAGLITVSAATAATAATVASVATVASIALSAGMMAIGPPKPSVTGSPEQFKADTQAPVPYIMGRTLAGGYIGERDAFGGEVSDVENPYQVFEIIWSGGGPVQEIESFTVDRTAVTFDGSGAATAADYVRGGEPYMWLQTQLGACPESSALSLPSP